MGFLKTWMRYYSADSSVADTDLQDLLTSININRGKGGKTNTLEISLNNPIITFFPNGKPRRKFVNKYGELSFSAAKSITGFTNYEDRVEIYAKFVTDPSEDIVTDDNLLFSGQILSVNPSHDSSKVKITLKCQDRTFNLLNRISSAKTLIAAGVYNAPEMIQLLVRTVAENNAPSIRQYDVDGNLGTGPGYIYPIDARLFSEGIKGGADSVNASSSKTIVSPTATYITDGVEAGDIIRNNSTYEVAIVREVLSETSLIISKVIFTTSATASVSNGFIADFRPDGLTLAKIAFSLANKPTYEWVDGLCQTDYWYSTGDVALTRPTQFYVDSRNRLHVFHPDNNATYVMDANSVGAISPDEDAHIVYSTAFEKNVFDTINFIIFKAGEDMNGQQISYFAQDPSSGSPIVKDSYRPFTKIAELMKQEDNLTKNADGTYDYPASYPHTPAWNPSISTSSDSDYNNKFRAEARARGVTQALRIINQTANPRWKGTITLRGENFKTLDLVDVIDLDCGINYVQMRIQAVRHQISPTGWQTTLDVQEDLYSSES